MLNLALPLKSAATDFGWANAGWHRPDHINEVQTPNMNSLVAKGIELDRACKENWTPFPLNRSRLDTHCRILLMFTVV